MEPPTGSWDSWNYQGGNMQFGGQSSQGFRPGQPPSSGGGPGPVPPPNLPPPSENPPPPPDDNAAGRGMRNPDNAWSSGQGQWQGGGGYNNWNQGQGPPPGNNNWGPGSNQSWSGNCGGGPPGGQGSWQQGPNPPSNSNQFYGQSNPQSQQSGPGPVGMGMQEPELDESKDPELVEFDEQFKTWEKKFESWREENKNHPDKAALSKYEETWTKWRDELLQKRQDIRKTKLEALRASKGIEGTKDKAQGWQNQQPTGGPNAMQGMKPEVSQGLNTGGPGGNQNWGSGYNNQGPNWNASTGPNDQSTNWGQNPNQNMSQGFRPNQGQGWGPNSNPNEPSGSSNNWSGQPYQGMGGGPPQQGGAPAFGQGQSQSHQNLGGSQAPPGFGGGDPGQNFGSNQGPGFGGNQGQGFGANQRPTGYGGNQDSNFGSSPAPAQGMPTQASKPDEPPGRDQGQQQPNWPNAGPPNQYGGEFNQWSQQGKGPEHQRQNFSGAEPSFGGPNQGPAGSGPNQGSGFSGPNQGSNFGGPSHGSGFGGPNQQGQNVGNPSFTGPTERSGFGGGNQGQSFGGPNQGSGFGGPNQGPGFGGPNQGPGFGGPNVGSGFGGSNPGTGGAGSNQGPNYGASSDVSDNGGPDQRPGYGGPSHGSGYGGPPSFGERNQGPEFSRPNQGQGFREPSQGPGQSGGFSGQKSGPGNFDTQGSGPDNFGKGVGGPQFGPNQGGTGRPYDGSNRERNVDDNRQPPQGWNQSDNQSQRWNEGPNRPVVEKDGPKQWSQGGNQSWNANQWSGDGSGPGPGPNQWHGGPPNQGMSDAPNKGWNETSGPNWNPNDRPNEDPGRWNSDGPPQRNWMPPRDSSVGPPQMDMDRQKQGPPEWNMQQQQQQRRFGADRSEDNSSWKSGLGFAGLNEKGPDGSRGRSRGTGGRGRGGGRGRAATPEFQLQQRSKESPEFDAWKEIKQFDSFVVYDADPIPKKPPVKNKPPPVLTKKVGSQNGGEGASGVISAQAVSRATGNVLSLFKQRAQEAPGSIPGLDLPPKDDTEAAVDIKAAPAVSPSPKKETKVTEVDPGPLNIGPIGVKQDKWKPPQDWYEDEDDEQNKEGPNTKKMPPNRGGKKKRGGGSATIEGPAMKMLKRSSDEFNQPPSLFSVDVKPPPFGGGPPEMNAPPEEFPHGPHGPGPRGRGARTLFPGGPGSRMMGPGGPGMGMMDPDEQGPMMMGPRMMRPGMPHMGPRGPPHFGRGPLLGSGPGMRPAGPFGPPGRGGPNPFFGLGRGDPGKGWGPPDGNVESSDASMNFADDDMAGSFFEDRASEDFNKPPSLQRRGGYHPHHQLDAPDYKRGSNSPKIVDYGHKGDPQVMQQKLVGREDSFQRDSPENKNDSVDVKQTPKVITVDDLISVPGRFMRPPKLVIILRGLPGAGKSTMAKMIKDKEIENGGSAPRILCLDDYFMIEVEKMVTDAESGRKIKTKVMEYEYEVELEGNYRAALIKSFKKQVDEKFFPFIIIDCINSKYSHYKEICDFAKKNEFEPYIADIEVDLATAAQRNCHNRTVADIKVLLSQWEPSAPQFCRVDLTSYIQDADIQEVVMEDCEDVEDTKKDSDVKNKDADAAVDEDDDDDDELETFKIIKELRKSKWDTVETQEETLAKLDGVKFAKKRMSQIEPQSIDDWLQLSKDYANRKQLPGKKRVRWADMEERKRQMSARDRGFVLGQTDWQRMTDPSLGSSALVQVHYIEPRGSE